MTKTRSLTILFSISLALSACGGGGGDGSSARNVGGTWQGALTKISDTCKPAGPNSVKVRHQVTQNQDAVTLLAESGFTFLGNTVGENGFSVDSSNTNSGSGKCTDLTRIEYDSINNNNDVSADTVITINRSCNGAPSCTIQYSGTVSRVSDPSSEPAGEPTIVPGTPQAVAGGCSEINPRTVAGTFSGNGGCGISNTEFSFENNTVVLEPFGANGLTSFKVESANTTLANSINTDLTILGTPGMSCSVICSPPSTFSVRCLKEGGASCLEKF